MKILILNWRDIKNPSSGGAEILTHEIAKRFVKWGHQVTQFSSCFPNCLVEEKVDGVKIIRRGHPDARFLLSSVHFLAFLHYKRKFEGKFDVVIDEVHGLPFFTPWYVKEKKAVLICEVANELWIEMFGNFFGTLGRLIEKFYLKFIYVNVPFLTISDSSKEELLKDGVKSKNITVLPMGITFPKRLKKYEKEKYPTLIFVGRLSKSKGVEDALIALKKISKVIPRVTLWVVGRGDEKYTNYLSKLVQKLKVQNKVTFFGFVSEEKKFELMERAYIVLVPSIKEGWGLTVPEAAFVSTPSIVYNSPGLRDVLKDSSYKVVIKSKTPQDLAKKALELLRNKEFFDKLENQKLNMKEYSWDNTARAAIKVLEKYI